MNTEKKEADSMDLNVAFFVKAREDAVAARLTSRRVFQIEQFKPSFNGILAGNVRPS